MTTSDKYTIDRSCRMYQEMFSYLQEKAEAISKGHHGGSIITFNGEMRDCIESGVILAGEIDGSQSTYWTTD